MLFVDVTIDRRFSRKDKRYVCLHHSAEELQCRGYTWPPVHDANTFGIRKSLLAQQLQAGEQPVDVTAPEVALLGALKDALNNPPPHSGEEGDQ
jgi:hypothetical protein